MTDLPTAEREAMERAWGSRGAKGSLSEQVHQGRVSRKGCFLAGWRAGCKFHQHRTKCAEAALSEALDVIEMLRQLRENHTPEQLAERTAFLRKHGRLR